MITGSRRGEVSALRWRHVDSDRAILWVHRSNAQTKTEQRREVALDPHTIGLLNHHRELWEQRCSTSAVVRIPTHSCSSPLPTAPPRTPQGQSVSDTAEWRSSSHCGAPASTLCGHYSATELVAADVDLRTVAGRLGHGNGGATTLKVYAAWVDEADRRAAAMMASIMPRPVPLQQARGPYEKIVASLRDDTQTGRLKPGDQLPTVAERAVYEFQQRSVALGDPQLSRGRHGQWPRCPETRKFRVLQPPVRLSAAVAALG